MTGDEMASNADILYKRYIPLDASTKNECAMNENARQIPLYQQIYDEIKGSIENGTYQPKQRIPSEPELADEFGVSRITVRRAIEELCAGGYLVKQQGRGTFVSTPHISRHLLQSQDAESFTSVCAKNGLRAGARVVARQIVPARPEELEFFHMSAGELLLYIQRIRLAEDQPIFEENVFLPYRGYESFLTDDLKDCSLFDKIAEVHGSRPSCTVRRTIGAVRATAEQASRLAIPANEPLLYLHAFFADNAGEPVCVGRQYYVGSRYRFE